MNGSLNLQYRLAQDRSRDLLREAERHRRLHLAGSSTRARAAQWLHALAERLEPELADQPRPALR